MNAAIDALPGKSTLLRRRDGGPREGGARGELANWESQDLLKFGAFLMVAMCSPGCGSAYLESPGHYR